MKYLVEVTTHPGEVKKKEFNNYRDALCYATDFFKVRKSEVTRNGEVINNIQFSR